MYSGEKEDDPCSGSGDVLCPGESSGEGGVCLGDESGLCPDGNGSEDGLCSGDESGLCSGEKSGSEVIEGAPTFFTGSGPKLLSSLGVYMTTFSEMTWVWYSI